MTTPQAAFETAVEASEPRRARAPYGLSLLVALGNYATLTAAVLIGMNSIPASQRAPDDCVHFGSCLSTGDTMLLIAVAGLPVVVGFLGITLLVLAAMVSIVRSAILAGTATSWLCVLAGGLIWLAVTGGRQ